MDEAPPPPAQLAKAQFIAMMECYRRLFFVWCVVPILLMVLPMSIAIYLSILDYWTRSAFVCTILTMALTVVAVGFIRQRAPSEKAFYGGLQRQGLRIFLALFAVSCVTTRLAVVPLLRTILPKSEWNLLPNMTWTKLLETSVRLSVGTAILGLAVVFRFIGPSSLVRCSTVPLVSHPLSVALRSAWAKCTSAEALLDLLAGGPSETPGELFQTAVWQKNGRRYQRPTLWASLGQVLLATTFATVFAYITILKWYSTIDNSISQATLTCVCILSVLLTLPLDGFSHEVNPKRYLSDFWLSSHDTTLIVRTVVPASITAPFLSIFVLWLVWKETPKNLTFLVVTSIAAAGLVSFYVIFLDLFSRRLLFTPGVNVKLLVENIYDDIELESFLAVVLQSLLYVDETLIQAVAKCTERRASIVDIEQDEVKRNKVAMEIVAHVLLNKNPYVVEAPLEEDMLRFLILESIGGSTRNASIDDVGKRHMQNLLAWIQPKLVDGVSGRYSVEPPNVPLVRALCAVAGGLGEALHRVTVATKVSTFHTNAIRPSWILPPGAVASGEFAITAAARLIVLSLDLSGRGMSDWRSSHLSVLVVATLNAAYRLRTGAIKYASLRHKPPTKGLPRDDLTLQYEMATPESLPLLVASDQAAYNIMRTLKAFDEGRNVQLAIDNDCLRWTALLLAKDP